MFLRILRDSLFRQKRRKAVVLTALSLGAAAATSLGDIALDVGDKMSRELKAFGANLTLLPRGGGAPVVVGGEDVSGLRVPSYLGAKDIVKAKDNFWKNNILALAPVLDVSVQVAGRRVLLRGTWFERVLGTDPGPADPPFLTGIRALNPYWRLEGRWPDDRNALTAGSEGRASALASQSEVLLGRSLAGALGARPGTIVEITGPAATLTTTVAGILSTGDEEDDAIVATIEMAQRFAGLPGRVSRIQISALTTPESVVYERLGKDPRTLSAAEFEKWTCTPFVSSIAYELERAIPDSEARVIRRIADSEGRILGRTSGLMLLIALMATLGAALTVTSALTTSVLERRSEIGLLKAMGAGSARVVGLFLAEAAALGTIGGILGAGLGAVMARWVSASVFGSPVSIRPLSVPLAIAAALAITSLGCILPIRRILKFRPFEVLRGL